MSNAGIKYSIIIPVLNEEKYLLPLLKQAAEYKIKYGRACELIVSDGGSSDATVETAKPYADKIIVPTPNKPENIAIGRNRGALNADGDILIFVNGDVVFYDINSFFAVLERDFVNSEFVAFTCKVEVNPDERKLIDVLFASFYNRLFSLENLIGLGMGRGECQVIRREIFFEAGGYNPLLAAGEDFELFKRIRRKGKILFSRKTVVYESSRRYRAKGHLAVLFSWLLNSAAIMLTGRSVSKLWKPVR